MRNLIKNPLLTFILGIIITLSIVGVYAISASEITYNDTTVDQALDDLYTNSIRLDINKLNLVKGTRKINTTIGKTYLIVFNVTSLTSQAYTPSLSSGYELLKQTDIISASFNDYIYKTRAFIVRATANEIEVSGSGDANWNSIGYYEF